MITEYTSMFNVESDASRVQFSFNFERGRPGFRFLLFFGARCVFPCPKKHTIGYRSPVAGNIGKY